MDQTAFRFLLGSAGQELLARARAAYNEATPLAAAMTLRKEYAAEQVAAALTQIGLRRRAYSKFGSDADAMYFTPDGLEQATQPAIALYRAGRVTEMGVTESGASGTRPTRLLDLGCGIGSDLIAFARRGLDVRGVERDPVTAAVAAANLQALALCGSLLVADVAAVDRGNADVTFADPSRRSASGRTFDPRGYSPPWSFVEELLQGRAAVKVAPGIPHELVPAGVEAEWISWHGGLKEATLWSGPATNGLSEPVRVRATVLREGVPPATLTDRDPACEPTERSAGQFVYEPDDAVIRAHLVTAVCALVEGWLLDQHIAYVSSDRLVQSPFARAFEVIEVLPFQEKQLRAALRARDIGTLTIKKRGVAVTPEALRARLGLSGSRPATLMLSRTPESAVALLVEPRL